MRRELSSEWFCTCPVQTLANAFQMRSMPFLDAPFVATFCSFGVVWGECLMLRAMCAFKTYSNINQDFHIFHKRSTYGKKNSSEPVSIFLNLCCHNLAQNWISFPAVFHFHYFVLVSEKTCDNGVPAAETPELLSIVPQRDTCLQSALSPLMHPSTDLSSGPTVYLSWPEKLTGTPSTCCWA